MLERYLLVQCIEGGYFTARREIVERTLNLMRLAPDTPHPELEAMADMARKLSGIDPEGYA